MNVGDKTRVIEYYRDKNRNIQTKVVAGTIVSGVRYDRHGVAWRWCTFK